MSEEVPQVEISPEHEALFAPRDLEMKVYSGSCHCGSIKYTAELPVDLSKSNHAKCNCTICHKTNFHTISVQDYKTLIENPENDPEARGDYTFASGNMHHVFCKKCGVRTWAGGYLPEFKKNIVALNINTLDDVDLSGPEMKVKTYHGGRDGKWTLSDKPVSPGGW